MRLRSTGARARIVPHAREVRRECADTWHALHCSKQSLVGFALPLMFLLERIETLRSRPFQSASSRIGDETIIRIHLEVPSPRELRVVTRHVRVA